jgi:predicted nucleotide-binding protein
LARRPVSKTSEPERPVELAVPREEAKRRLVERIERGQQLTKAQINTEDALEAAEHDYHKWSAFNTELLKQLFTTDALSKEYAWWGIAVMGMEHQSLGGKIAKHHESVTEKLRRLDSIVERLELYPLAPSVQVTEVAKHSSSSDTGSRNKKVFVVHGHDEIAKTNLEVFLHEIGLEPIVLHRQADEGLTVIEKFEKHADVGYAFIILTPDEIAYLAKEEWLTDDKRKKEHRARPNVIFEFGYFVGKLGRSRVCCIYTGDVTLPSDVNGLIYKKFERSVEEVAYGITKDLKASGYDVA